MDAARVYDVGVRVLDEERDRIGRAWFERAACRGMDPDLWFPPRGRIYEEALVVCDGCEVRYECLVWGLRERLGVWGGRHDRQRRALRRQVRLEGLEALRRDARTRLVRRARTA